MRRRTIYFLANNAEQCSRWAREGRVAGILLVLVYMLYNIIAILIERVNHIINNKVTSCGIKDRRRRRRHRVHPLSPRDAHEPRLPRLPRQGGASTTESDSLLSKREQG